MTDATLFAAGALFTQDYLEERAHRLVKPDGMVGLLTPSGIASDLSASAFFRKVATGSHVKALYDFENRRTRYGLEPFFPDVDSRFKFMAMMASPSRTFEAAYCGFFLQSVSEQANIYSTFPIVERQETERWGRYRSRDLCLAWINALLAGQPHANVEG